MRDPRREQPVGGGGGDATDATCDALAAQLTCGVAGPATAARRAELHARLNEALGRMDAIDCEVLALRHYEQLTSAEAAQVLGIQERAAAKRYGRALERLRELLEEMPGGLTEFRS
jgi:RNA polymerase sigma-70 factor (ECF subfamily)